jgi:hypothetical protein
MAQAVIGGGWAGTFTYPGHEPDEAFTADFTVIGDQLTGTIDEVSHLIPNGPRYLRATVAGSIRGEVIAFDKTYDGGSGWSHTVRYWGRLNAEGTAISGSWQLPGLQGSFMMVRPPSERETVAMRMSVPTG